METERLEFPEVTDVDIVFGRYPDDWFKKVLDMKEEPGDSKYNDMMEELFFKGGKIPVNESLDIQYRKKGIRILKAILDSFSPKHEEKEKVCGLILKSLCS